MSKQALWQPSIDDVTQSNIKHYEQYLLKNNIISQHFNSYKELHRWSVKNKEIFWESLWRYFGIIHQGEIQPVLPPPELMIESQWFPSARLNFAENLLRHNSDANAIVAYLENGERSTISFKELRQKVAQLQASLKASGVGIGDRVAGLMPNIIETVIAMLATTSLGAAWSSCSPEFGVNGVTDRLGQIQAKVLFATDGYYYNGKTINSIEKLSAIVDNLPELKQVVIVSIIQQVGNISSLNAKLKTSLFDDYLQQETAATLSFERLPFDHPLYIMYSSGTTGLPKCIVHGAGGTLLQHLKELSLHCDLSPHETIFYYSTCGWMMWNWLISSLAIGATLVLYDGSPFYPSATALVDLIDQEQIKIFGSSAKYLSALEKSGVVPKKTHQLNSLKTLLSTGSPLSQESFHYVYQSIKEDICLSSISGGTDILSCFILGNPTLPVYAGELQCAGLGMDVKIFDLDGSQLIQQKGELVCCQAFPSMPIYFWNDPEQHKYKASYFSQFDNVWAHGDYGEETSTGGFIIHGRSDTVLNPGGVRIGTAEIYRQVERIARISDCVVVGQNWQDDVRIVLFVQLASGKTLDETLVKEIKYNLRQELSPRHVPAKILQVNDIPKTLSGKTVELAVSHIIHNRPVKNREALANPEALEYFKNRAELQD